MNKRQNKIILINFLTNSYRFFILEKITNVYNFLEKNFQNKWTVHS